MKRLNIKIWDKFWLRSCYYHDLYSAVSYLGIATDGVFWTNVALAEKDFTATEETLFSQKDNEEIFGYARHSCNLTENELKQCIDGGCPVIMAIDRCNLEKRAEINGKIHAPHFLLVYGYDENAGTVNIVDHDEVSSCKYKEKTISIDNLFLTNGEYRDGIGKDYENTCKVIYKTGEKSGQTILSRLDCIKIAFAQENSAENLEKLKRIFAEGGCAVRANYEKTTAYLKALKRSVLCLQQTGMFENGEVDLTNMLVLYSKLATILWKGYYKNNFDFIVGIKDEINENIGELQQTESRFYAKWLRKIENR